MTIRLPEQPALILASASPRRLDLLRQIGIQPDIVEPPEIDETPLRQELPTAYARRIASRKCDAVAGRHPQSFVLAADTVVACGRRLLPKPEDEGAARACLELLSGRRHRVLGGLSLAAPGGRRVRRLVTTIVAFKRLSRCEVEAYLAGEEWRGKAGGYAIQGRAASFVSWINGSYSNVVGLPLFETNALLEGAGYGAASRHGPGR